MKHYFAVYLLIMALVTYALRAVPFMVFRRKVRNRFFRSFLYYNPYTVLAAMTFPPVLYATASPVPAALGTATALFLAYRGKGMVFVSLSACAVALLSGFLIP